MVQTDAETPREHGMLDVGDGQHLYWEEWGRPGGVPVLYLHGGPGGTLGASGYRRNVDLEQMRVIGFEQRGAGRSRPHVGDPTVSLSGNTTASQISDIEMLRRERGVDAWIVNGVSWGSTLALAYAQAHPRRVLGIVLFAVTAMSRSEVDWITEGVGALYPEAWDRFATFAEQAGIGYERGRGRIVEAYAALLNSPDPQLRDAASWEWVRWEDAHISIGTGCADLDPRWSDDAYRRGFARLVTHYWAHDGFCDPPLLDGMVRLRGIPGRLIHGRLDVSAPAVTAWQLAEAWGPAAELTVVEGEGHGGPMMVERWREGNLGLLDHAKRRLREARNSAVVGGDV